MNIQELLESVELSNSLQVNDEFDLELSEDTVIETEIVDILNDGVVIELDQQAIAMLKEHGIKLDITEEYLDEAAEKSTKAEAKYQDTPKNGQRCDHCTMWRPPHGCSAVKGVIAENGWCSYYKRSDKKELSEGLNEMDKSAPQPGRDGKVSHSTYGSRDKKGSDYFKGKESPGKAITKKQLEKDALDILKKQGVIEAEYQGRKVSLGKPFLTPDGPKKRSVYVRKPNGRVVKVNFGDKKMKIKKSNPQRRKSFRARHRCANPGPRTSARYWSCKFW